jgi:metal-responsive CopG/Arc/MetJ family transcriptional regulator
MAVKKVAISVPSEILKKIDRLAKNSKTTRSGLITHVLREVSHVNDQREISEVINRLFEDSEVAEEQGSTSHLFLRAAEIDDEGEESGW